MVTFKAIALAVRSLDNEGQLVWADGKLAGMLVHLIDEIHAQDQGSWFLEIGFGSCAGDNLLFRTLDDAAEWFRRRLGES